MTNTLFSNIHLNGIDIIININHELSNEYSDQYTNTIINEISEIKNTIINLLNNVRNNDKYNLRKKTVSNLNIESVKSNIIINYINYQNKLLEYYIKLDNLKSNCIRNNDYLVDWYDNTKKQLNLLNIEHDNLKSIFEKVNNNYLQNENKFNNYCAEQKIKVDTLNSELSDVKTQRDFLKGGILKNKEVIYHLDNKLNEKIKELEMCNIEHINNNHQIQNYGYEIENILNDRKYIIDNNLLLREQFNELKKDFEMTTNKLNIHISKTANLQKEKETLEKYIFKQQLKNSNQLEELNELLQKKQTEQNKIINQACELMPEYIWDDIYGFISKEYEVVNTDNIEN